MARPGEFQFNNPTLITTMTTGVARFFAPVTGTIVRVVLISDTAPTGGDAVFDVNVEGVTIFGDPGDRVKIEDGDNFGFVASLSAAVTQDDEITVDFDEFTGTATSVGDSLIVRIQMQETGALATDAQLRDRSTHTGTQLSSTISDLATILPPVLQINLCSLEQTNGTNGNLTPNGLTSSLGRVFPFTVPPGGITINKVITRTAGVVANCMQVGIYDSSGAKVYDSGAQSSTANYTTITANLPVTLPAGTYYFMITNNNLSSASNVWVVSQALGAASLPRWGSYPVTNGALPASITPASITDTVGGFPVFTTLSNV